MNSLSDRLITKHNRIEIEFIFQTLILDGKGSNKVIFTYKNIDVDMFFDDDKDNCYSIVEKICKVIDVEGKEGYRNFKMKYERLREIERRFIIIENNVYNYNHSILASSGDLKYHHVIVKMENGTVVNNIPINNQDYIQDPFKKDVYNYKKSVENTKYWVKDYYKKHKVLPDNEHLEKEATDDWNNINQWFCEVGIA